MASQISLIGALLKPSPGRGPPPRGPSNRRSRTCVAFSGNRGVPSSARPGKICETVSFYLLHGRKARFSSHSLMAWFSHIFSIKLRVPDFRPFSASRRTLLALLCRGRPSTRSRSDGALSRIPFCRGIPRPCSSFSRRPAGQVRVQVGERHGVHVSGVLVEPAHVFLPDAVHRPLHLAEVLGMAYFSGSLIARISA